MTRGGAIQAPGRGELEHGEGKEPRSKAHHVHANGGACMNVFGVPVLPMCVEDQYLNGESVEPRADQIENTVTATPRSSIPMDEEDGRPPTPSRVNLEKDRGGGENGQPAETNLTGGEGYTLTPVDARNHRRLLSITK